MLKREARGGAEGPTGSLQTVKLDLDIHTLQRREAGPRHAELPHIGASVGREGVRGGSRLEESAVLPAVDLVGDSPTAS